MDKSILIYLYLYYLKYHFYKWYNTCEFIFFVNKLFSVHVINESVTVLIKQLLNDVIDASLNITLFDTSFINGVVNVKLFGLFNNVLLIVFKLPSTYVFKG